MLQNIRDNSSGVIAKIIVGLIAVTFVVTGINFFAGGGADKIIANVGEIEITERQFISKLERERRQLMRVVNDPSLIDEELLRQGVFKLLVEQAQAENYASELDLNVADQLIDQAILNIPQFQRDGQFDSEIFDGAIGQMGLSRLEFRDELKRNLIKYQVMGVVEGSSLTTLKEVTDLFAIQNQKRSGRYTIISANEFLNEVKLKESDIQKHYEENLDLFKTEEIIAVDFVLLSGESFADDVRIENNEVKTAYEEEVKASLQETEKRVRHILISNRDDAEVLASSLIERIEAGEDFAILAKEFSDDLASKDIGGDLGFAPPGTFVAEFEEAIDNLALNGISSPVKTQYGYHIIELLESRAMKIDPFELRKVELRDQLVAEEKSRLLKDSLEEFSNIAFSGTLDEVSEVYNLEIQTSEGIKRSGGSGLFEKQSLAQKVFDEQLRNGDINAEVFEVKPGVWMTFRVASYEPQIQKSFSDVYSNVKRLATEKKALDLAQLVANDLARHWRQGEFGASSPGPRPVNPIIFDQVDRNSSDILDSDVLSAIFESASPGSTPSINVKAITGSRFAVTMLESVESNIGRPEDLAEFNNAVRQIRTNQENAEFWDIVNTTAEVFRN